jgi:hypothetical protein
VPAWCAGEYTARPETHSKLPSRAKNVLQSLCQQFHEFVQIVLCSAGAAIACDFAAARPFPNGGLGDPGGQRG